MAEVYGGSVMTYYNYSHYESHHRKLAEFEEKENFASPAAASTALKEVKEEQARVCETPHHPGCACLIFTNVRVALQYAALGNPDPWAVVRDKQQGQRELRGLQRARRVNLHLAGSLHPDIAAKAVGTWLGQAYKYYLK